MVGVGPEAFEEARRRDVPILLSVGYAAWHWWHVPGLTLRSRPSKVKLQLTSTS